VRGVDVPERTEDFSADPVELFFDLVYVFAFSRLVALVVHHPDWTGVGEFALLFTLIWLPWTQFTWSANAVSGNTRPVRALFLLATVASVPMAGAVDSALGDGGPMFAISLSVILSMALFTMIAGLDDEPGVRRSIIEYSIPNFIAIALMIVGAFAPHDARIAIWIAAIVTVVAGTLRAGGGEWLIRPGHFAERHGLIVIVALGEIIVALGTPVAVNVARGDGFATRTQGALVAAGAFACLLWWSYFDRPAHALEHRHEQLDMRERGRFARDVYTYAHLPLVAGIILCAAALEEIALHPAGELAAAFRWLFVGGMALVLGGVAIAIGRAFRVLAVERVVAAAFLVALVPLGRELSGLSLLIVADVVLAAMLVVEHVRIERPS
jgi:low temperature requirement protein LtrA